MKTHKSIWFTSGLKSTLKIPFLRKAHTVAYRLNHCREICLLYCCDWFRSCTGFAGSHEKHWGSHNILAGSAKPRWSAVIRCDTLWYKKVGYPKHCAYSSTVVQVANKWRLCQSNPVRWPSGWPNRHAANGCEHPNLILQSGLPCRLRNIYPAWEWLQGRKYLCSLSLAMLRLIEIDLCEPVSLGCEPQTGFSSLESSGLPLCLGVAQSNHGSPVWTAW